MTATRKPGGASLPMPSVLVELHVSSLEAGNYAYGISYAGTVLLDDAGFPSVATALVGAGQDGPEFWGFQVQYRGVVVGTYTPHELAVQAEVVSALCIDRAAVFGNHG